MRTAKTADSSGDDMLAELQVRLRSRKDSIGELGLDQRRKPREPEATTKWRSKSDALPSGVPLKRRGGAKGKSKSEKLPSVSESEIMSQTKWHVRPTENEIFVYDDPATDTRASPPAATKIPYSAGSRINNIPPPPKTPPPVLANKIHQGGEPTPKSTKSTAAEAVAPSTTSVSPRGSKQPKAKIESSEKKSFPKKDTSKSPEGKSKNSNGVKELASLFGGRNGSKGNDKEKKKEGGVAKTAAKKPKDDDMVRSEQLSSSMVLESGRMAVTSGRTTDNQKRDDSADTTKDGEGKRPENEASSLCVREHEGGNSSLKSKNPYQNVFDDPAFSRFDKRLQSVNQTPTPPAEEGGGSLKKEKKPKPLPRKGSLGSQALRRMASDDRDAPQSNSTTTEATQSSAAGPAITISAVDVECKQRTQEDKVAEMVTTSQQPETKSETAAQDTNDTTVSTETSDTVGDLPSRSSSDITSQAMVLKPLEELESEIDLLAGIAQLPPLREVAVPHKAELTKTKSYNPGGGPITRRTTPKERKELRHGVRSDGAQLDSDEDDYIPMHPGHMHKVSESEPIPIPKHLGSVPVQPNHRHQLSAPEPSTLQLPSNPRSSAYYLKILPPMPSGDAPALNELLPPKSPGNDYVDMETQQVPAEDLESKSLPIHLLHENETRSSAGSETTPTFSSLGKGTKGQINSISRFRPVKYSTVTIKQTGRQTEPDINSESIPKLKMASGGTSNSSTLKYPKVEIGVKNDSTESDTVAPLSGGPELEAAAGDLKQPQTEIPEFAREVVQPFLKPLPPVPKENVYYMTHKGGKLAPLSNSAPGGRVIWHDYVEIDEEELEKEGSKIRSESTPNTEHKELAESLQEFPRVTPEIAPEPQRRLATNFPPEVPKRPDYLEKLTERTSAEYSYAAIPGQNMFGLQWMNFYARIPRERTPQRAAETQPKKATPPRYIDDSRLGRDRPPTPPPKSDSLLREQGLIPAYVHTPTPYLIPVPIRKGSTPDLTLYNKKATPPPTSSPPPRSPKDVIAVMKKELLSIREKDRDERESSPRRHRRAPPPRPPYPPKISPRKFQKATSTSLLSLSDEHVLPERRVEEMRSRNTHRNLARQRSQSTGEISPRRAPLRQSKSYAPESKPAASDPAHVPASEDAIRTAGEHTQLAVDTESRVRGMEDDVPRASPQVKRRRKKGAVQGKIDRKSLALIMQNREAIVKQLSLANDQDATRTPNSQQESAGTPGSAKKALVRGLGEILLELDTLLQNEVCTEEDLISAIEQQLHIQIRPQTQPEGGSRKNSRDETQKFSGGGVAPLLNPAIEITDGDVEDVVSFVNENRVGSPDITQEDANPSKYLSPPPEMVMKPRSATVIIKPDSPKGNSPESEGISSRQSKTTPDHLDLIRGESQAQPLALSLVDSDLESPSLESPGSGSERVPGMRDIRSRSAGHKQLRRVNAKRRPSIAAESVLSINGSTSFCNGSGVFTHLGGKLTNLISGIEIEIPEGAVPKGKKQKVWFDVLQTVYNYSEDEILQRSSSGVSDSIAGT